MRILVVSPDLYERHRGLLTQMHRLRAQVFGSRLGWEVEITADEERDEYDRLGPTYILEIATDRVAAASAFFLRSDRPCFGRPYPSC